jgi:hypothetical protein
MWGWKWEDEIRKVECGAVAIKHKNVQPKLINPPEF